MRNITEEQRQILHAKSKRNMNKILAGEKTFKLDDWDCQQYLNVTNDTWHRPVCQVLKRDEANNKVYIKAMFFGSGVASHPVRKGWILEGCIDSHPNLLGLWFRFINLFKKDPLLS